MISKIQLNEKIKEINGRAWLPIEVAKVNDQVVRMALFKGNYHWHTHQEDEFFYVLKGKISIRIKGQSDLVLQEGEIAVVPKGVEHCPKSDVESYVLMFEPQVLKSTGDA
ncbi:MAG TPA: cupin domain-containing protein [Candidatus Nanoarchaeia archaeon]|nr:cupin domain-containing protein [Candidatus Nanoarchaeia archaeon]